MTFADERGMLVRRRGRGGSAKEEGIMGRLDDGQKRMVNEEGYPSRCHNKSGK